MFVKQSNYAFKISKNCFSRIGNSLNIINLLRCQKTRAKIRRCYERVTGSKDINATSLVLFHGPLVGRGSITVHCNPKTTMHLYLPPICIFTECPFCLVALLSELSEPVNGQLLTGDLNLKEKYDEFRRHMGSKLESVAVCLLPHHGSEHCWNAALMRDARNCRLWIASAGINNKRYHHPSESVIKDITKNGNAFYWVNDYSRLALSLCPSNGQ